MIELPPGVDEPGSYGRPGEPINHRSPFFVGFTAALGVAVAYVLLQAIASVGSILFLILIAGFLAIGLDPAVEFLVKRRLRRGLAVAAVMTAMLAFFGGFIAAAVPPISSQATQLVNNLPADLEKLRGNATFNNLDSRYHIVDKAKEQVAAGPTLGLKAVGGVLGVGKALLGVVFSTLTVLTLLLYFLANLPSIKRVGLRLVPESRRDRVGLLTDEVLMRVGGYVLGNLATSVVAGLATLTFLSIFDVPYAVALSLFVAITDLIPLVGATIGAVVVSVVALFVDLGTGLWTIAFFTGYQQFENFVLVPRVMKATVDVSPVATIVAALIGGSLLGVVGALLAIPIAAAIQIIVTEVVYPKQDAC